MLIFFLFFSLQIIILYCCIVSGKNLKGKKMYDDKAQIEFIKEWNRNHRKKNKKI